MDYAHQFSEAFIPPPWRAFGVLLRPFTIGHSILLERVASPFISGGIPSVDDIALAILFCTQTNEDGVKSLFGRTLAQRIWQWRFKRFAWKYPDKVLAGRLTLKRYIDEARETRPTCFVNQGKTRTTFAPDALTTVTAMLRLGYSESEVLNMPYAKANWLYYGWLENEGVAEFRDPKHKALLDRVAEAQRKMRES